MNRHVDDGQLQDLREGLLPPREEERVRAHLEECPRCREEYEALEQLMDGLAELPEEGAPPRDLWPQIAWRTGVGKAPEAQEPQEPQEPQEAQEARATHVTRGEQQGRRSGMVRSPGTVTLPAWQLLAASLVVALVSGGAVWFFLSGGAAGPGSMALEQGAEAPEAELAGWAETYGGYDQAVEDLEAVLDRGREVLDPETVQVLEENLATIEEAIQESQQALARDPGSTTLRRILAENLRRKIDLLRHAAVAVYAAT